MKKKPTPSSSQLEIKTFLKDAQMLLGISTPKKYSNLVLQEYPFDLQLLNSSSVYRESRRLYFELGGKFTPRICSTMRGLSAQDLFNDEIDYTPGLSELIWFKDYGYAVSNAEEEMYSFTHFNEISLFHEQNHRVIWRLLPPVPSEQKDVTRYLNFAESLVVVLDLVLGDQLGKKLSNSFERMKVIYRPGGEDIYFKKSKAEYRNYLLAVLATTYYAMEILHNDDILAAVNYVLPGQKQMNKVAVKRGLQLSELFTRVTNPQWQEIYWKSGMQKLNKIQAGSKEDALHLPDDPLDLEEELLIAKRIFASFGI